MAHKVLFFLAFIAVGCGKKTAPGDFAVSCYCKATAGMPSPVFDENGTGTTGSCLQVDEVRVSNNGQVKHTSTCGMQASTSSFSLDANDLARFEAEVGDSGVESFDADYRDHNTDETTYQISVTLHDSVSTFRVEAISPPANVQSVVSACCSPQ